MSRFCFIGASATALWYLDALMANIPSLYWPGIGENTVALAGEFVCWFLAGRIGDLSKQLWSERSDSF